MRRTPVLTATAAACLTLTAMPAASAAPYEHATFHEEFDSVNDCGDGPVLEFHDVIDGRVVVVRHGDGFLYGTQHWTLTAVATIPGTALTVTVVNKGLVGHDLHVTANRDGTITVLGTSPARVAVLGPDGRTESHFSGLATYEQLWDDAGTPDDPSDDELIEYLSYTTNGHDEAADVCEVARRYTS